MLERVKVFLVILVIFVLLLFRGIRQRRLKGLANDRALEHRVVALGADWTPLVVEDLVELILWLLILLTTRSAIHGADSVIWLALTRGIPLVTGPSPIIMALPIVVVVTSWVVDALLLLFIRPSLHRVT